MNSPSPGQHPLHRAWLGLLMAAVALGVFGACSKDNPVAPPPQGASVSGVVLDASSQPIGGARVTLATATQTSGGAPTTRALGSRTTTTDSITGAFQFTGVGAGDYLLTVDAFRYLS